VPRLASLYSIYLDRFSSLASTGSPCVLSEDRTILWPMDKSHGGLGPYKYSPTRRTNFVNVGLGDWIDFNRVVGLFTMAHFRMKLLGGVDPNDPRIVNLCHGRACRAVILLEGGEIVKLPILPPTLIVRSEGDVSRRRPKKGRDAES